MQDQPQHGRLSLKLVKKNTHIEIVSDIPSLEER